MCVARLRTQVRRGWKASATGIVPIALVLLLVACGGGGDDGSGAPDPSNGLATATATVESTSREAMCDATHRVAGTVSSPALVEISGLAASRSNDDVLWAHNDSGDTARVFAMDMSGGHVESFELAGARAFDWEAMAVGPGPQEGASYLYLGDIGDNQSVRQDIVVYRALEPIMTGDGSAPVGANITEFDTLTLVYPDGPHDAETLLVDPRGSGIFIVTKELAGGPSLVFRAPADAGTGGVTTLEQVAEIDFPSFVSSVEVADDAPPLVLGVPNLPTGGDVSPDGGLVIIRTYGSAWVWSRPQDAPLADAFDSAPCEAPSVIEQQGEAIAFDADGRGYTTVSEGERPTLHHFSAEED